MSFAMFLEIYDLCLFNRLIALDFKYVRYMRIIYDPNGGERVLGLS